MKFFVRLFYKTFVKFAYKIGQIKAELEFDINYLNYQRNKRKGYWERKLKKIGSNSHIYPNVIIHVPNMVSLGERVNIAEYVHMWGGGGIEIGDNVIIASHTVITSQTHSKNANLYRESSVMKAVKIGNNCWIGSGAIIFPGVEIGDNSIIGAQTVVTRNVPANSVFLGVPGNVIETLKNKNE